MKSLNTNKQSMLLLHLCKLATKCLEEETVTPRVVNELLKHATNSYDKTVISNDRAHLKKMHQSALKIIKYANKIQEPITKDPQITKFIPKEKPEAEPKIGVEEKPENFDLSDIDPKFSIESQNSERINNFHKSGSIWYLNRLFSNRKKKHNCWKNWLYIDQNNVVKGDGEMFIYYAMKGKKIEGMKQGYYNDYDMRHLEKKDTPYPDYNNRLISNFATKTIHVKNLGYEYRKNIRVIKITVRKNNYYFDWEKIRFFIKKSKKIKVRLPTLMKQGITIISNQYPELSMVIMPIVDNKQTFKKT